MLRNRKKLPFIVIVFFLFVSQCIFPGALAKPRRIYVLKTDHFDILFPEVSKNTAKLLADNADCIYELAKSEIKGSDDLHIPVIISPDSDMLSVDYTSSPYNRIVIFDGVPETRDTKFQNTFLSLFYHEVFLALSQSVRSPVNQKIYKTIGGTGYQPISMFYLPFSFVEARAFLQEGEDLQVCENYNKEKQHSEKSLESEDENVNKVEINNQYQDSITDDNPDSVKQDDKEKDNTNENEQEPVVIKGSDLNDIFNTEYGRFYDQEFLELLSIAKYENKFPHWIQAGSDRDVYPGRVMNEAAGSAFAAYLIQTYGIDKYIEFWTECGELNFLLTSGMFQKVYGINLNQLWKDFEAAVPMPSHLEEIKELNKKTKKVFPNDREGVATNLILSDYGLIWYDDIRQEVDILDWDGVVLMRRLLFLASGVKKLSLSPNGRYLVVSFYGISNRQDFRNDKVWIYDLKKRQMTNFDFRLRDGSIVKSGTGKDMLAGINVKEKESNIQIYDFEYDGKDPSLVYEKKFNSNEYPSCLTYAGKGKITYLVSKNNNVTLNQYNLINNKEVSWNILYKGQVVNIKNLRRLLTKKDYISIKKDNLYTFEYYLSDEPSFRRIGIILLDENFVPSEVYLQKMDVAGGISSPIIFKDYIYFCSARYSHTEIQYLPLEYIKFEPGTFMEAAIPEPEIQEIVTIEDKKMGDYDLSIYNPFKYMMHFSVIPLMAIKDLTLEKRQKLWPSLGATLVTSHDLFMNNKIMFSASFGHAKLGFSKTVNPTVDDYNDKKTADVDENKNISFGVSLENSSTPVDIRAGCLFKFNTSGEYKFNTNINAFLDVPIGMAFSKFNFKLFSNYVAATDYYDSNLAEHYPSLSNWPAFNKAYETAKLTFSTEYSNIHQSGVSKYEERGFSIGIKLDSFWDLTEIKLLNSKCQELKEALKKGDTSEFTKAQISQFRNDRMLEISQLILGVSCDVKIPRLTPFNMLNGFVLSFPTSIRAEVFNEVGTAVSASAETQILGYECQDGIPFLYLYFSRLGLKFGYNIDLNYDTYKVPLPDLRVKNNLWNVFTNLYIRDSIYLIYNMDFCPAVGRFSDYHFNLNMKTEYFFRSKGFGFSMNFRVFF